MASFSNSPLYGPVHMRSQINGMFSPVSQTTNAAAPEIKKVSVTSQSPDKYTPRTPNLVTKKTGQHFIDKAKQTGATNASNRRFIEMYSFDTVLNAARNNKTNDSKKGPNVQQAEYLAAEIDKINSPDAVFVPCSLSKTGWKRLTNKEYQDMQDKRARQGSTMRMPNKMQERNTKSVMQKTFDVKNQFMTTNQREFSSRLSFGSPDRIGGTELSPDKKKEEGEASNQKSVLKAKDHSARRDNISPLIFGRATSQISTNDQNGGLSSNPKLDQAKADAADAEDKLKAAQYKRTRNEIGRLSALTHLSENIHKSIERSNQQTNGHSHNVAQIDDAHRKGTANTGLTGHKIFKNPDDKVYFWAGRKHSSTCQVTSFHRTKDEFSKWQEDLSGLNKLRNVGFAAAGRTIVRHKNPVDAIPNE